MEWKVKMETIAAKRKIVIESGPIGRPYAKIILQERRNSPTDRRTLHTFIAKDQRSGIADRRKNHYHNVPSSVLQR
jgi:hypothetical protein